MAQRGNGPPTQQPEEDASTQPKLDRRQIRASYRNLQQRAVREKDQLGHAQGNRLQELLSEADRLHNNVHHGKEHAVDARLFAELSGAGLEAAKKLANACGGITSADLIAALWGTYGTSSDGQPTQGGEEAEALAWHELDRAVLRGHLAIAPGVGCMLGPMDAEPKVRKAPAARAPRQRAAPVVRPEEAGLGQQGAQEGDKQETDRNMEEMYAVLEPLGAPGCTVPELVCDHQSFAQTIENTFTLSFLVRDNKVYMWHDSKTGLRVRVHDARQQAAARQQAGKKQDAQPEQRQFVMQMDHAMWEVMCGMVPRLRPIKMRHRAQQDELEREVAKRAKRAAQEQASSDAESE